jgi:phosphoribosylformylglycinamidine synthase
VALGCGINPRYGRLDPYAMALLGVDEALRNVVAVGADPGRVALLDNFCWGNPSLPDRLGGLVRAAAGCHDAALGFGAPFVSGKDSLNNEHRGASGASQPIPGTLLITALGIVPDLQRTVSMDLKAAGSRLYLVGPTRDELGGSLFHELLGADGGALPRVRLRAARALLRRLHRAIRGGLARACHDLSEGGLAVAAAEMAIAADLGLELDLARVAWSDRNRADAALLFSESATRFLVEVDEADAEAFETDLRGTPLAWVGSVVDEPRLLVRGLDGRVLFEHDVATLREAWRTPLERWLP